MSVYEYKMRKDFLTPGELGMLWAGQCGCLGSVNVRDAGLSRGGKVGVKREVCSWLRVPSSLSLHSLSPKLRAVLFAHMGMLQGPTEVTADDGVWDANTCAVGYSFCTTLLTLASLSTRLSQLGFDVFLQGLLKAWGKFELYLEPQLFFVSDMSILSVICNDIM